MIERILNLFGRKRFDKTEEVASEPIQRFDEIFQHNEYFESDRAGSLTLSDEYKKWEQIQAKINDDMTPKEYNAMLLEEYGPVNERRDLDCTFAKKNPVHKWESATFPLSAVE